MKIPKQLKICGLDYKVIMEKNMSSKDGLAGQHRSSELIIRIQDKDYHQQKKEQVFFHEILHAVDMNYNNDSLKEEEVDRISSGLYQVLSDNNLIQNEKIKKNKIKKKGKTKTEFNGRN